MAKRPAAAPRLNAASLAALGADRLAAVLMEAADGDANLKRRLRLELAAARGPEALVSEIDKRLTALAASRARISWRKRGDLITDLEAHRRLIQEVLAPADPGAALDRLIAWFNLFRGLAGRTRDARGELTAVFEAAAPDLWRIAEIARVAGAPAEERLAEAIDRQPLDYARWLGAAGDTVAPELARAVLAALDANGGAPPTGRAAIRRLADRAGDLDRWLSLASPAERSSPDFAAETAERLLEGGRVAEARAALEAVLRATVPVRRWALTGAVVPSVTPAWERASIALLDAEGREAEAQAMRWAMFERDLSAPVLSAYLSRLPDFEDVEALDRAFAHAAAFPDFRAGLRFLIDWPAHREAAAMVEARRREAQQPSPDHPAWAGRLAHRYPSAAEILDPQV